MVDLTEFEWDLDGLMLEEANGFFVVDTDGLEDTADLERDRTEGASDGGPTGHQRLSDRLVVVTFAFHSDTTEAQKDALRVRMSPAANRLAKRTFRWKHRDSDTPTKRVDYIPAPGRSLRIPGDYDALANGFTRDGVLRLQVDDPVIYSDSWWDGDSWVEGAQEIDVAEATPGSATEFEFENVGSLATVSPAPPGSTLGTYQFSITAGAGGCTWPFLRNVDHMEEFVYLAEELGDSGVFSVSWDRVARRNVTVRYAEVKGPDGSPIPNWPVIRPGTNTFEMGCTEGSVTGTFEFRSTW